MALKVYAASGKSTALGVLDALYSSLKVLSAAGIRTGIRGKHTQAPQQPSADESNAEGFKAACSVACR